jgi:hypothetical protein
VIDVERARAVQRHLLKTAQKAKPEGSFVLETFDGLYFSHICPLRGVVFVSNLEDATVYIAKVEAIYMKTCHFKLAACTVKEI